MPAITDEALHLAEELWNYHDVPNAPQHSDFILALGSNDIRVGEEAARLTLADFAPLLVLSGAVGKVTAEDGGESEARRFAKAVQAAGVSTDRVILEESATNTGENFVKTRDLLARRNIAPTSGIFVTKPYMKRRALATALKQWPNVRWTPHAPAISFREYPDENISTEQMIQLMVGDLQRIAIYPALGFQVEQHIPSDVISAYNGLVDLGFNKYVIKDAPPIA